MGFNCGDGLQVEALGDGYLVLVSGSDRAFHLRDAQAAAFELARSGATEVPDELVAPMAGLVELGIVQTDIWTRRKVLGLGGVAAAAAVAVVALPSIAAAASPPGTSDPDTTQAPTTAPPSTTPTPTNQMPFDVAIPGDYTVNIDAGRAVALTVIGGGAGANRASAGGAATEITGTLPARPHPYTLLVTVAGGGTAGTAMAAAPGGSGNPKGGNGGPDGGESAGGGGGGASTVDGPGIQIVAPGGAGTGVAVAPTPATASTAGWDGSAIAGNAGGKGQDSGIAIGGGGGAGGPVSGTAPGGAGGYNGEDTGGVGSPGTSSGGGAGGYARPIGARNVGGGGGGGGLVGGGGGGGAGGGAAAGGAGGTGSAIALGVSSPTAVSTSDATAGNGGTIDQTTNDGQDGRVTLTYL